MSRIRNEVLFGIAAVSLIGFAKPAEAKDDPPRLRTDIELHVAKDGRGETQDFRSERPPVERVQSQSNESSRPHASDFMPRPTVQMKTEVMMRVNGERDRGSEASGSKTTVAATPRVDVKAMLEKPEPPHFKTEVTLKMQKEFGSDEGSARSANVGTSAIEKGAPSAKAVLQKKAEPPQFKTEVKLKMTKEFSGGESATASGATNTGAVNGTATAPAVSHEKYVQGEADEK